MSGKVFLVGTPIGNLEDVTTRALRTLREVSFVVCEDTRRSRILLEHYGIRKELISLPAFDERNRAGPILQRVAGGEDCALITDAGSPGISDPGEGLVSQALAMGLEVHPVPGPSAVVAALGASGLPTGRFHFVGFLPRKGAERKAMMEELGTLPATLVMFESPRRTLETLRDLEEAWGDRRACIAREVTKVHEEFARGTLRSLIKEWEGREILGELVLLVEGRKAESRWTEMELKQALARGLAQGEKLKALATDLSRRSGWSSQQIYRLGLSVKSG